MTNQKINNNAPCPCGSGLKYKKCCKKKNDLDSNTEKNLSVSDILSFLKSGLENINLINKDVKNVNVKDIKLLNNESLECQFYAEARNSMDVKIEVGTTMSILHGFFKDDSFKNINFKYYAVRAFDEKDTELMNALSSKEVAASIGNGDAIDWMKGTIFQENTEDYRLSVAKRQISEIENAIRKIIIDRLKTKHGNDWFVLSVGKKLRDSVIGTYFNQFGDEIENGDILINYTFLLHLKKIICTNWKDFSDIFESKIRFEELIVELNLIRREEAHNRNITESDLKKLDEIYKSLMIEITEKYPDILPSYLIDNWKIQLKEIMLKKLNLTYSDEEIQTESNPQLKLYKTITNLQELINHIKDKEIKLTSVVTPVQKKKTHQELLNIVKKYRILHEELMENGKSGNIQLMQETQAEIDLCSSDIDSFTKRYVIEES